MLRSTSGALVLAAVLGASAVRVASQQGQVFRAQVEAIEVEVRVTTGDGDVVSDLTADDFTLFDDGVSQTISTFSFVDLTETSPVLPERSGGAEPDTVTNVGTGRMWVMLLGGTNLRARLIARRFVQEAVGVHDEVAVIHVHGVGSAAQGFTRNRNLLEAAIDRQPVGEPNLDPFWTSYRVLEEVSTRLGEMSGGRKAVLFVDPPAFFAPDVLSRSRDAPPDAREVQAFLDQRDAIRAATRNNVAVYVVSTAGLTTDLGMASLMRTAGLRVLAEETGGDAIVNTNSYADGFARIVRDVGAYYLLGYVPAPAHRDGEVHDLDVRVNRPGVTVRARRSYYAPAAETGPVPEAVADGAPASLSTDTLEALRLPIAVSGLGMELFAAPFRGADGSGTVLLGAQVRGADLELGPGEPIEVAFRAMTTEGVRTPGKFTVFTLDLLEDSRTAVASDGLRVIDRITLPRGRHQLRFVVRQPNGRTGMVVADVEIPAFHDEPLSLSGVVLASEGLAAQPSLLTDAALAVVLPAPPTAVRRFSRTDALTAYAEVYTRDDEREAEVTATLESVADGRRLALDVVAAVAGGGPGRMARVPLAGLEPGDYVLTFEARVDNRRATRQVPFSVPAD